MSLGRVVKAYRFPRSLLATTHFVCSHTPLSSEIPARRAVSIVGTRKHVQSVKSDAALSKCPSSPTSLPFRGSTNCSSCTLSPVRHHTCTHSAAVAHMLHLINSVHDHASGNGVACTRRGVVSPPTYPRRDALARCPR